MHARRFRRHGPEPHQPRPPPSQDWPRSQERDMSLIRPKRQKRATPTVESLEGRALLSGPGHALPTLARPAIASRIHTAIRVDPGGYAAILSALNGGLGSEWVKL